MGDRVIKPKDEYACRMIQLHRRFKCQTDFHHSSLEIQAANLHLDHVGNMLGLAGWYRQVGSWVGL